MFKNMKIGMRLGMGFGSVVVLLRIVLGRRAEMIAVNGTNREARHVMSV